MNIMKRRTFLLTTARPAVVGAWLLLDLLFIPRDGQGGKQSAERLDDNLAHHRTA